LISWPGRQPEYPVVINVGEPGGSGQGAGDGDVQVETQPEKVPAVYCLPGRVVVPAGALAALGRAFPVVPLPAQAVRHISVLAEMAAAIARVERLLAPTASGRRARLAAVAVLLPQP
jgi:hypothetical protein